MKNSKVSLTSNVKTSKKQNKTNAKKQAQKNAKTQVKTSKNENQNAKQKLRDFKKLLEFWFWYTIEKNDKNEEYVSKNRLDYKDFEEYLKLLDTVKSKPKKLELQVKKGAIYNQDIISNDISLKWYTMYQLKTYKNDIIDMIDKLEQKKAQYIQYPNLVNLIDRQIQKNYFYMQTYSAQIFDLYFEADTLTKYNYDLLHFDLLLKNQNLNSQLLYYRFIDIKKRYIDTSDIVQNNDYIKGAVYNKTERDIIEKLTNDIIITEIAKNDKVKLDFLRIYTKNIYKMNNQKNAMCISRYKKYILDRYWYLL